MPFLSILLLSILQVSAAASLSEVLFPSSDGGEVAALVYGEGEDALVLVHGARFNKESWAKQAPVFAEAGFRVLAIDMRGRGKSHGGPQENAEREIHLDVLAAVRFAREHGATTVSVLGASLGGWAAGQAAVDAEPGEIDRLVLLAATQVEEPENMQGKKLFIVGRDDLTGSGRSRLESVREQFERAEEPKELVVIESDAHAQFLFETEHGEEVMKQILEFLQDTPGAAPDG